MEPDTTPEPAPKDTSGALELTGCDREPVAFLGALQEHGALLVFDSAGRTVQHSANAGQVLGWNEELLGTPLVSLFSPADCERVKSLPRGTSRRFCFGSADGGHVLSVHDAQKSLVVEAERSSGTQQHGDPGATVLAALARIDESPTIPAFTETLASLFSELMGFQRVMIYRFLPDWTGEIVSEVYHGSGPIYKGLRFPATDIPGPAREVFLKNWSRQIHDTLAPTVELCPAVCPEIGGPTDLSLSYYRAASPVHIEYLQNMGVRSSFTGSIRVEGKLWGLVACHHDSPKSFSPSLRNALDLLLESVSIRLSQLVEMMGRAEQIEIDHLLSEQTERLQRHDVLRLDTEMEFLRSLVPCDALAVMQRGYWHCDQAVSADALSKVREEILQGRNDQSEIYSTTDWPASEGFSFPGILFLQPRDFPEGHAIVWLRAPDQYSIRWAGDPRKSELAARPGERLHPRVSFELYVEEITKKAQPWSERDLRVASRQGQFLSQAMSKILERMELRNRLLERSNRELEAFAFMASHDLQEPIRAVNTYVEVLIEDYGDALAQEGVAMARQVLSLTERMNNLLQDLLEYAKLGEQTLYHRHLNLDAVVRSLLDHVYPHLADLVTLEGLPRVYAHESFVNEIFSNLLSNASKYRSSEPLAIRIGTAEMHCGAEHVAIFVEDNGIGIDPRHHRVIFDLFRRLQPEGASKNGSGAGLTIARRMVERHGGSLWVESELGRGATFYFTLPRG